MGQGYVDIYLLPVRDERLGEYREQATTFGAIVKDYGGLGYRDSAPTTPRAASPPTTASP